MKRSITTVHRDNPRLVEKFLLNILPDVSDDRLLLWCLPSLEPVEKSEKRKERESCATAAIDDLIKVSIDLFNSQRLVSCVCE